MKMMSDPDISVVDTKFSERIISKYESFPPYEPTLITPLSKKLHKYSCYPHNLTLALPSIFKSSILNKYIQKSSSDSLYNNIQINMDLNLPTIQHQWAKNKKKDFEIFSSQSYEYIKKQYKQTNRTFSLYFKGKSFTTYNIIPINHLKIVKDHTNKYLKNLINESSSKNILNSLLFTNILLKKSDSLKNHYNIGAKDDKIINTVLKSELNEFNNLKLHAKELSYYYPEMEHQKTFQAETVKEKILGKDQGFQDSNNSIPDIDVNKMADQVYSIIERKIKIERERRGLFV